MALSTATPSQYCSHIAALGDGEAAEFAGETLLVQQVRVEKLAMPVPLPQLREGTVTQRCPFSVQISDRVVVPGLAALSTTAGEEPNAIGKPGSGA
jgi:hypothetical protein